ncbi:hypothetical protein LTR17_003132 [Elasticomyces elasticus]|nr:hypothetical protein LTR17_003132 [Elasticomyces elasticus]
MSLETLPVELRLQIYQHVPELRPRRHETVAPHIALTPGICRASRWLRAETLPVYASDAQFSIQADEDAYPAGDRVAIWMRVLGESLRHVRSVQLSRHWIMNRPTRGQGHVGFYLRLERIDGHWKLSTGTYPVANDLRAMRIGQVTLMNRVIQDTVVKGIESRPRKQPTRLDMERIAAAMRAVASRSFLAPSIMRDERCRQGDEAMLDLLRVLHRSTRDAELQPLEPST